MLCEMQMISLVILRGLMMIKWIWEERLPTIYL